MKQYMFRVSDTLPNYEFGTMNEEKFNTGNSMLRKMF